MSEGVYKELKEVLCKFEEKYELSDIYKALKQEKKAYLLKKQEAVVRQKLQNIPEAGELLDLFKFTHYEEQELESSIQMYITGSFNNEVTIDFEFEYDGASVMDLDAYFMVNDKIYEIFETEEETVEYILEFLKILRLSNVTVGTVITFLESMCPYKLHRLKFTEEQLGKCIPITTKSARSTLPRPNNEEDNSPPKKIQKTK